MVYRHFKEYKDLFNLIDFNKMILPYYCYLCLENTTLYLVTTRH